MDGGYIILQITYIYTRVCEIEPQIKCGCLFLCRTEAETVEFVYVDRTFRGVCL